VVAYFVANSEWFMVAFFALQWVGVYHASGRAVPPDAARPKSRRPR
jgi:hypothetical protein